MQIHIVIIFVLHFAVHSQLEIGMHQFELLDFLAQLLSRPVSQLLRRGGQIFKIDDFPRTEFRAQIQIVAIIQIAQIVQLVGHVIFYAHFGGN